MKTLGLVVILASLAGNALALTAVPEIDANSAYSALTFLSGGFLILRSRRKK